MPNDKMQCTICHDAINEGDHVIGLPYSRYDRGELIQYNHRIMHVRCWDAIAFKVTEEVNPLEFVAQIMSDLESNELIKRINHFFDDHVVAYSNIRHPMNFKADEDWPRIYRNYANLRITKTDLDLNLLVEKLPQILDKYKVRMYRRDGQIIDMKEYKKRESQLDRFSKIADNAI